MATKSGRAWKMERASVTSRDARRPRSNKYSASDGPRPQPGSRSRIWVGGYKRGDGTKVGGYYRSVAR
jgi:hypothetical protein